MSPKPVKPGPSAAQKGAALGSSGVRFACRGSQVLAESWAARQWRRERSVQNSRWAQPRAGSGVSRAGSEHRHSSPLRRREVTPLLSLELPVHKMGTVILTPQHLGG